ncbi:hypothetical protein E2C01_092555 [Portunus trituberculatus]|uniref:Uncharacterized protein n=1 Tax=Portunus trituberculatus TaxID=210409 RepID=A0A5B7JGS0_PORTR|nr:hypothetical protein [Portunus trituberculatus]
MAWSVRLRAQAESDAPGASRPAKADTATSTRASFERSSFIISSLVGRSLSPWGHPHLSQWQAAQVSPPPSSLLTSCQLVARPQLGLPASPQAAQLIVAILRPRLRSPGHQLTELSQAASVVSEAAPSVQPVLQRRIEQLNPRQYQAGIIAESSI